MKLIEKICQTRYNLKKYLKDEWDVSHISDLSLSEIDALYGQNIPQSEGIPSFGPCTACNFSVPHLEIPSHRLHVIYYNFGDKNSLKAPKLTKTCGDKISVLYSEDIIAPDDSLIIIFQDKITENIAKTMEQIFTTGQEFLKINNLSDDILEENENLEHPYRLSHFRNIHAFYLDHLANDITEHAIVPKHRRIRKSTDIQAILKKCNAKLSQLPIILRKEPMAQCLRLAPGDICEITRNSSVGETTIYRVCV